MHDRRGIFFHKRAEAARQKQKSPPEAQRFAQRADNGMRGGRAAASIGTGKTAATRAPCAQCVSLVKEQKSVIVPAEGRQRRNIGTVAVHAEQGFAYNNRLRRIGRQRGKATAQTGDVVMRRGMDVRACQRQGARDAGMDASIHKGVVSAGQKRGNGRKVGLITAGEEEAFGKAEVFGKGLFSLVGERGAASGKA